MPFVRLALVRYQPKAISGAKISRVAMAEFAQLLPRRRAVVKRTNNGMAVHVSLHGPVPDRGPMQYQNDSAHLNVSFVPPPGSVHSTVVVPVQVQPLVAVAVTKVTEHGRTSVTVTGL